VVKIEVRGSQGNLFSTGSGFVLDTEGGVLTNAHVVREARFNQHYSIEVVFQYTAQERRVPAQILSYNDNLDLAYLKMEEASEDFLSLSQEEGIPLMSPIIVLGYPLGENFKSTPGVLQSYQNVPNRGRMIDLSSQVDPGNSGGPVLNAKGEVIAVVSGRYPGYNFNLAIPASLVLQFMNYKDSLVPLHISSNVEGARVFLNGVYYGLTPISLQVLDAPYEVLLQKEGYVENKLRLESYNKDWEQLTLPLEALLSGKTRVSLNSQPLGAKVYLNNEFLGETPLDLEVEQNRRHRLRLEKQSYESVFEVIRVGEEVEMNLDYQLRK